MLFRRRCVHCKSLALPLRRHVHRLPEDGGSKSRRLVSTETDSGSEGERVLSRMEIRLAVDYSRDFEKMVSQPKVDEEDLGLEMM